MNRVMISTTSNPIKVQEYINNRLKALPMDLYQFTVFVKKEKTTTFIIYNFTEILLANSYIVGIAKGIGDYIQYEFSREYGVKVIQDQYGFSIGKSKEIAKIFHGSRGNYYIEEFVKAISKEIINTNKICIDGWIRFRLTEYKEYMIKGIENIIFEYFAYQEYQEFIELLKEFIATQNSLVKLVHIMPSKQKKICLYNEKYEEIIRVDDRPTEDVILGVLLTASPAKIRIHQKDAYKNKRLIQTIKIIYEDKISFCKACKNCEFTSHILTPKKL